MKRFASNQSPNFLCAAACLAVLIAGCGDNSDSSTDPGAQKAQITAASGGPTEAGGSPTVLATGQRSPHAIVLDATSVYWTNREQAVMRLSPR